VIGKNNSKNKNQNFEKFFPKKKDFLPSKKENLNNIFQIWHLPN
jgi:hypothetical protein